MAACWTCVVIALAALLASFCSSHAFTPAPSEQPSVSCLPHDCTFPIVQAHTNACYVAPADSCPMNQSSTKPLSTSLGKNFYILSLHGYQNNSYCAYNLGPTSECKITELIVAHMDMGPRALNCTHSYNTSNPVCCQCNDHVSIKYSGTEYCLADSQCPIQTLDGVCRFIVHGNTGDHESDDNTGDHESDDNTGDHESDDNTVCCQCYDHVSIKCLADSECPVQTPDPVPKTQECCNTGDHESDDNTGDHESDDNTGDLIVSYRTDAEIAGHGFIIYVAKDMAMIDGGNCAQLQELHFEVKDMPHLYQCPLLTHDQLVAHVVRFSDEVEQTITRARGKDPLLRTRMFLPPQPQCYCYGTCTAKSAMHQVDLMNRFTSQSEAFSHVSYINSPDPLLRQMARAASEGKLQPLKV